MCTRHLRLATTIANTEAEILATTVGGCPVWPPHDGKTTPAVPPDDTEMPPGTVLAVQDVPADWWEAPFAPEPMPPGWQP
jgi:hypothetical protein